ncbi:hypothetical protein [Kosakonia sacchari]|uniref:Uncharacterized protein n=1 Tax=Kosakonia sacchari TaxID=1158459 RepID=A0ABZ0MYB4_9ENTR|nr:hypothetical protein [Kosakonia sacchari]WOZ79983.1 hypothetical protein Q8Y70_23810 [Kosakonia sacchari]
MEVTVPPTYQYGAWRVAITLDAAGVSGTFHKAMTGLPMPVLPHRVIVAASGEPWMCAAKNRDGTIGSGFSFIDGHCELDVYTSGIDERSNRTAMREVARVLAAVTYERIQPFLS